MRWNAPAGCPSADVVEATVNEILGRDAFDEEEPDLEVRAQIVATEDAETPLRVSLRLVSLAAGVIGERRILLPSTRCEDALPPVSLVLSLMLDHSRREIELLIPAPARTTATDQPAEVRGLLALGAGAHHNLVPATMVLFDVRGGVAVDAWSVEAWVEITPEASADADSGGVAAWAGLGGVSVCGSPIRVEPIELGLCADIGVGWIASRGYGVAETRAAVRPQVTLTTGARLRLALTDVLGLRFEAGARALAFRDRLLLAPSGEPEVVFEPWPVVPYARLSLDLRL